MFWFFGPEACGILAPWPGIEPAPPALEGEVLTTGPPGKSLDLLILLLAPYPFLSPFPSKQVNDVLSIFSGSFVGERKLDVDWKDLLAFVS